MQHPFTHNNCVTDRHSRFGGYTVMSVQKVVPKGVSCRLPGPDSRILLSSLSSVLRKRAILVISALSALSGKPTLFRPGTTTFLPESVFYAAILARAVLPRPGISRSYAAFCHFLVPRVDSWLSGPGLRGKPIIAQNGQNRRFCAFLHFLDLLGFLTFNPGPN